MFSAWKRGAVGEVAEELQNRSWGRWRVREASLVYVHDEPRFEYDLRIETLASADAFSSWESQLTSKQWFTAEVANDLRAAHDALHAAMREKGRAELEEDPGAPPPMSKDEFAKHVATEWKKHLANTDPEDEGAFQQFLERYPCLLPDPYASFQRGHHFPLYSGVITQPELPGFRAKRPDFMLIAVDSGAVLPILIEIEAPAKRWATEKARSTAEFTQAHDQLAEWRSWFQEPENQLSFRKLYGISESLLSTRNLTPRYVLIYGRRAEATRHKAFAKKRNALAHHDEVLMTYDRLSPNPSAFEFLTLRLDRSTPDNHLAVVTVPPTFGIHTYNALSLSRLKAREEAINASSLMSEERRRYLIEQLKYADAYAHRRQVRDPYGYDSDGEF